MGITIIYCIDVLVPPSCRRRCTRKSCTNETINDDDDIDAVDTSNIRKSIDDFFCFYGYSEKH